MEFVWPIRVYYEDTDAGGVVYHANYLHFLERARSEWLRSLGFEQDALIADPGILFAVRRSEVDYLKPARFNDLLSVRTSVVELRGASFTFAQDIVREADDELLCRGRTLVACIDARNMTPARLPAAIKHKIHVA